MKRVKKLEWPFNAIDDAYEGNHKYNFNLAKAEDVGLLVDRFLEEKFNDRDMDILHLRYIQNMSYTKVGNVVGLTGTRVSQIIRRMLRFLLRSNDCYDLRYYLRYCMHKDCKYMQLSAKLMYEKQITDVYSIKDLKMIVNHILNGSFKCVNVDFDFNTICDIISQNKKYQKMVELGILGYVKSLLSKLEEDESH